MTRRLVTLGFVLLFGLTSALAVYSLVYWLGPVHTAWANEGCACGANIGFWQHPWLYGLGLGLTTALVLVMSVIWVAAVVSWRSTRRLLSDLQPTHLSLDLRVIILKLGARTSQVTVFDQHQPQAFCAGIVFPRVYCSSGLLSAFESDQVAAVLAHELVHARNYDPMLQWMVNSLTSIFPRKWRTNMRSEALRLMECQTDESATRVVSRSALGTALLQLMEFQPPQFSALASTHHLVEQRLRILAGFEGRPRVPWKSIFKTSSILSGVLLSAVLFFIQLDQVVAAQHTQAKVCEEIQSVITHDPELLCPMMSLWSL